MRKRYIALAGLLGLLVAGGAMATERPGSVPNAAAAASTPVPPGGRLGCPLGWKVCPNPAAVPRQYRVAGIPAIPPRSAVTDPATPAFSAQDAEAFVSAHGVAPGRIESSGPRTVQKVEFVTERAVRARFGGEGTGLPDGTLLCLVTVQGTFSVSGPPTSGREPKSVVSHLLYQVFDAHTGNLLMQTMGPNN